MRLPNQNGMATQIKRCLFALVGVMALLLAGNALGASSAPHDGFKFVKVNSHEEPKLEDIEASFVIPNTSIKAGIFKYYLASEGSWGGYDRRLGFIVRANKFFYVDAESYSLAEVNYGISGNYFIAEGSGFGSTGGHNHLMILCQFNNSEVKFLDAIAQSKYGDFMSETKNGHHNFFEKDNPNPLWIDIQDAAQDGIPQIKLIVGQNFILYISIVDGHFKVNLNSELYSQLFKQESQKMSSPKRKRKSDVYYFYGFLSKKLDLNDIKLELKHTRGSANYTGLITMLENVENWDAAFHAAGEGFTMKQLDLERK